MLSTDRSITIEGSRTRARVKRYAARVASLVAVVPGLVSGSVAYGPLTVRTVAGPFLSVRYLIAAVQEARRAALTGSAVLTSQDPFEVGLIGLFASWVSSIAFQVQVHIDFYDAYFKRESLRQRWQSVIAPFVLRRSDAIRAVSPRIENYLTGTLAIPLRRVTCLPVASDIAALLARERAVRLAPSYGWETLVLAASRFVKQKNVPLLIRAFSRAAKTRPRIGLLLVGDGPERSHIEAAVRVAALGERIRMEHWTERITDLMAGADIFALPSDYEGWGMTAVEASAMGTPVVMTDVGCAGAVVKDGESGLVVPVRGEEAFAAALARLLDDTELRSRLGAAAREAARTVVSGDAYDNAIVAGWRDALNQKL
jgi:glycosyltransferase involved in cell wall biosynthesis